MTQQLIFRDGTHATVNIFGQGTPIVFIHGWGVNCDLFEHQCNFFSQHFQVITYDQRGHNKSQETKSHPTIETLAGDLVEVLEQLDLTNVICVGWSMGAMVTWQALSDLSCLNRIKGIATIDMSPCVWNDDSWNLGIKRALDAQAMIERAQEMRENWQVTVNQFVPKIFVKGTEDLHKSLMDDIIRDSLDLDPNILAGLWESLAVQDYRAFMTRISVPMLVTYGEQSQFYTRGTSEYIGKSAPNAELTGFAHSGHAPHVEEPEAFNQRLLQFINKIEKQVNAEEEQRVSVAAN